MNVSPTFLNFNMYHIKFSGTYLNYELNNIMSEIKQKLPNLLITDTTKIINKLNFDLHNNFRSTKHQLPNHIITRFLECEKINNEKLFLKIKEKNIAKFNKLLNNVPTTNKQIENSKWLDNFSDTQIPKNISEILSLGPNFSLPILNETDLPIQEFISGIEVAINDKPGDIKDGIRADVVNPITNFEVKLKQESSKQKKNKYLNKLIHNNPQILKPDKNNKTVVMNTAE